MKNRFNIDVRINSEVIFIDTHQMVVKVILNDGVKAFKDEESSVEITLNSGKKLPENLLMYLKKLCTYYISLHINRNLLEFNIVKCTSKV
ncbi:hypothetical protein [Desulfosporosinus shakirovi]|uniref:hypothetical protein n=1 Tax=Desulfosporosinus shakirovi TaxID=2885154 RepID=UPI001E51E605|nr:hypothetical protein [Desulfosporosinus sp. SRJS8]MCB8818867.1 hypothetical protein [Desulfosporosinus sp. SRJS8]